ncbi:Eyes absent 4 [Operophtera brumata]|uniref:Eyes absent 4 n=1 Tax=Operophtera brumata TaxID=104452 RepID=A0A0L7LBW1_OPEBR|nr:Eyes absent 4 [Operophtera brumata]
MSGIQQNTVGEPQPQPAPGIFNSRGAGKRGKDIARLSREATYMVLEAVETSSEAASRCGQFPFRHSQHEARQAREASVGIRLTMDARECARQFTCDREQLTLRAPH